jgi:hypothetical protein
MGCRTRGPGSDQARCRCAVPGLDHRQAVHGHVAVGELEVSLDDVLRVLHLVRLNGMQTQRRFDHVVPSGSDRKRVGFDGDPVDVDSLAGPSCGSELWVCTVRPHPLPIGVEILQVELVVIGQDRKGADVR